MPKYVLATRSRESNAVWPSGCAALLAVSTSRLRQVSGRNGGLVKIAFVINPTIQPLGYRKPFKMLWLYLALGDILEESH
jgi:hypothetical protein